MKQLELQKIAKRLKAMTLTEWLLFILALRYVVLVVRAFLPLGLPEIWRQTDTLAVALRYWMRWTVEHDAHPFIPAVLNSGDTMGYMPMEFPILNIALAPCFVLGPYFGKAAAMIFLFTFAFWVTLKNARSWEGKKIAGVPAAQAMLLLPILSLGAEWSGKFMPDYLSILFVTWAVGLTWEPALKRPARPVAAFFLASLGLLMKPTSISALFLMGAHPRLKEHLKKQVAWALPAIAVGFCYYWFAVPAIDKLRELPLMFALEKRAWLTSLAEFFLNAPRLFKFILLRPFFPFGVLLIVGLFAWKSYHERRNRFSVLWLLLILEMLPIAAVGGEHAHNHEYYFLSLVPLFCLIFAEAWKESRSVVFRALLALGLLVRLGEIIHMDLRSLYRPTRQEWRATYQCTRLKKQAPEFPWGQGKVFRSSFEEFPALGLCFGEREGSKNAEYGFFRAADRLPDQCRPVHGTDSLTLARCVLSVSE